MSFSPLATTTTTTATTTTTTTLPPCVDYLDSAGSHFVYWKGAKSSNPRWVGDNSISFQVSVFDRNQENWDAKNDDYIGFAIFSRTECGQPLVRDMANGNIKIGVYQAGTTAVYHNVYSYLRWDGDKDRRSFTIQFRYFVPIFRFKNRPLVCRIMC